MLTVVLIVGAIWLIGWMCVVLYETNCHDHTEEEKNRVYRMARREEHRGYDMSLKETMRIPIRRPGDKGTNS